MRFRSLAISWCVCAIYYSVQTSTASGHRSLDETSRRSSRHPLSDVEIPPDVLLERRRSLRGISESAVASLPTSRTDDRANIVDRFVLKRHSPRRKRRKKCSRRKQNARRKMRPEKVKFADEIEESKSSMKSSIVKSSSTFDAIKNAPTSTLSPTLELTTESSTIHFTDTITDVVSSTRVAATVVQNDTTRRRNSQRNPFHKKCGRTKCAGNCKEEETRIIDVLEDEFFPPNVGKSSTSQTSSSSSCTSSSSHRLQDRSRQDNHEYDV